MRSRAALPGVGPGAVSSDSPVGAGAAVGSVAGSVAAKVLEFIPRKPMRVFHGNVSDYLDKKEAERVAAKAATAPATEQKTERLTGKNRKEQRRLEALARQQKSKGVGPLKKRLKKAETGIAALEEEKATLTNKLLDPDFFKTEPKEAQTASERLAKLETELSGLYSEWSTVSEELEKAGE